MTCAEGQCKARGDGWVCSNRTIKARGLCTGHYLRWQRGEEINTPLRGTPEWTLLQHGRLTCPAHGTDSQGAWQCGREIRVAGLCKPHYQQQFRWPDRPLTRIGATPRRFGPGEQFTKKQCTAVIADSGRRCDRKSHTGGMCQRHHAQAQTGEPFTVAPSRTAVMLANRQAPVKKERPPKPAKAPRAKAPKPPKVKAPKPAAPAAPAEPFTAWGTLDHRAPYEERRRTGGTSDRLYVPDAAPLTAAQVDATLAAFSRCPGATPDALDEIRHMLTDPVPYTATTRGVR